MYAKIAAMYRFTIDQIARMTPYQQVCLIDVDEATHEALQFNSMEDYMSWRGSGK